MQPLEKGLKEMPCSGWTLSSAREMRSLCLSVHIWGWGKTAVGMMDVKLGLSVPRFVDVCFLHDILLLLFIQGSVKKPSQ